MSRPILGYSVEEATRLSSPVKIGGVDFDGSKDIDLPGVNKLGNQDTTGIANRAYRLYYSRRITIGNARAVFDGSSDVTWTLSAIGAVSQDTFDETIGDIKSILLDINGEEP